MISVAFSQHLIQVSSFPVLFHFNGEDREVNEEYQVFNYNDHAYVPIRFISENMGAQVGYTNDPNRISISYLEDWPPTIVASETNGPLTISLYSEHEIYKEGDLIRVWAVLENNHHEDVTIYDPDPWIHFNLEDQHGKKRSGERIQLVANPPRFESRWNLSKTNAVICCFPVPFHRRTRSRTFMKKARFSEISSVKIQIQISCQKARMFSLIVVTGGTIQYRIAYMPDGTATFTMNEFRS